MQLFLTIKVIVVMSCNFPGFLLINNVLTKNKEPLVNLNGWIDLSDNIKIMTFFLFNGKLNQLILEILVVKKLS